MHSFVWGRLVSRICTTRVALIPLSANHENLISFFLALLHLPFPLVFVQLILLTEISNVRFNFFNRWRGDRKWFHSEVDWRILNSFNISFPRRTCIELSFYAKSTLSANLSRANSHKNTNVFSLASSVMLSHFLTCQGECNDHMQRYFCALKWQLLSHRCQVL